MWLLAICRRRSTPWSLSVYRGQVAGGNAVLPLQVIDMESKLVFSEEEQRFYNAHHAPIHFTPMQQQLMLMFLNAPRHELTKQEICAALWPKKDDPSETLYTLIKRIKPILEANHIKMESERGRSYRLDL
jgi:DNA-binding response OmpR family regulator